MKAPKLKLKLPSFSGTAGIVDRLKAAPAALAGWTSRFKKGGKAGKAGAPIDDETTGPDVDDDDIPDYLKPTFVQRHGRLIGLAAAYFLFFATLGGAALYLVLNEEAILEAERERRPSLTIEELRPEIVRVERDADSEADGNAANEAAERTAANDPAAEADASDGDAPADAGAGQPTDEEALALLAPHPDPGLIEESPTGPLPIIGADGRLPWRVYSRPHNVLETRPQIAVVVTDLGVAPDTAAEAMSLPGPVTLAFAPYARNLPTRIEEARNRGHEVMLTLPMEPRDFPRSDPGPYALMTSLDGEANLERLNWILSRASGYIGLINYQGGAFTADRRSLQPVMAALADRGLVYLDTGEDPGSAAPRAAEVAGAPGLAVDIVADGMLTRGAILTRLTEAEVVAKAQKTAVVLVRPYAMTLDRVKGWAQELEAKGIVLAPLSAVIRARASAS
ncbi:MAG: divergent polysaccharide deacetylase family protein [Alphaproteobacteria bacterium]|nr:divergent polysaccharide deacetylase family protein [Alphaproteobacteria bacterium]